MTELAPAPAAASPRLPFRLFGTTMGYVIRDHNGACLAALPNRTEACGAAEMLDTAQLFVASPWLFAAAKLALPIVEADLKSLLESSCLLTPGTLEPRRETLSDRVRPYVEALEGAAESLRAAIGIAEAAA